MATSTGQAVRRGAIACVAVCTFLLVAGCGRDRQPALSLQALVDALQSSDPVEAHAAVPLLVSHGRDAVQPLLDVFLSSQEPRHVLLSVEALSGLSNEGHEEMLLSLPSVEGFRRDTLLILCGLSSRQLPVAEYKSLISVLVRGHPTARDYGILRLRDLGLPLPTVLMVLQRALEEDSEVFRIRALETIPDFGASVSPLATLIIPLLDSTSWRGSVEEHEGGAYPLRIEYDRDPLLGSFLAIRALHSIGTHASVATSALRELAASPSASDELRQEARHLLRTD